MLRRDFLASLGTLGGLGALGLPRWLTAAARHTGADPAAAHADDWRWLVGSWDVHHRRLKERLAGDTRWEEFAGQSAMWLTMDGLGTIDDNILEIPSGTYRGMSIRAFDPATGTWAIWWLDGRNPTHIEPPVRGTVRGDTITFCGRDTLRGRPVVVRFVWHDIHSRRPWWEQAFSPDDGATWEVNWRNWFTRTADQPEPLPALPDAPRDFDFLAGRWQVRHRPGLSGSDARDESDGILKSWPVLGGQGNVSDSHLASGDAAFRGMVIRNFDPASGQWHIWQLDGREPAHLGAPLSGRFADGVGTFVGEEEVGGRRLTTRVVWSRTGSDSPRCEQSRSADGGRTWETRWIRELERPG